MSRCIGLVRLVAGRVSLDFLLMEPCTMSRAGDVRVRQDGCFGHRFVPPGMAADVLQRSGRFEFDVNALTERGSDVHQGIERKT